MHLFQEHSWVGTLTLKLGIGVVIVAPGWEEERLSAPASELRALCGQLGAFDVGNVAARDSGVRPSERDGKCLGAVGLRELGWAVSQWQGYGSRTNFGVHGLRQRMLTEVVRCPKPPGRTPLARKARWQLGAVRLRDPALRNAAHIHFNLECSSQASKRSEFGSFDAPCSAVFLSFAQTSLSVSVRACIGYRAVGRCRAAQARQAHFQYACLTCFGRASPLACVSCEWKGYCCLVLFSRWHVAQLRIDGTDPHSRSGSVRPALLTCLKS